MHNVISPAPWFMAQEPVYVATTADGGDSISGVVDGDIIFYIGWGKSLLSTPSGYSSVYTASGTGLHLRVATKTASSESGSWPGSDNANRSEIIAVVRNATGVNVTGATAFDTSVIASDAIEITSINPTKSGALFCAYSGIVASSGFGSLEPDEISGYTVYNGPYNPGAGSDVQSKLAYKKITPGNTGTQHIGGNDSNALDEAGGVFISVY